MRHPLFWVVLLFDLFPGHYPVAVGKFRCAVDGNPYDPSVKPPCKAAAPGSGGDAFNEHIKKADGDIEVVYAFNEGPSGVTDPHAPTTNVSNTLRALHQKYIDGAGDALEQAYCDQLVFTRPAPAPAQGPKGKKKKSQDMWVAASESQTLNRKAKKSGGGGRKSKSKSAEAPSRADASRAASVGQKKKNFLKKDYENPEDWTLGTTTGSQVEDDSGTRSRSRSRADRRKRDNTRTAGDDRTAESRQQTDQSARRNRNKLSKEKKRPVDSRNARSSSAVPSKECTQQHDYPMNFPTSKDKTRDISPSPRRSGKKPKKP
ncbi:unnamed protein product, partial [Mesorhabditis spiculigera]